MGRNATGESLWNKDWLWALAIILIIALLSGLGQFRGLDETLFTTFTRLTSATPTPRIDIIAIDKRSLESLGQWPWPRSSIARLLNIADAGKPKVIAITLPLNTPQVTPGLEALDRLNLLFKTEGLDGWTATISRIGHQLPATEANSLAHLGTTLSRFARQLRADKDKLNQDLSLTQSLAAIHNVDLIFTYAPGVTQGNPDTPLPALLAKDRFPPNTPRMSLISPPTAYTLNLPLPQFLQHALGIGAIGGQTLGWNRFTGMPLAVSYYGQTLPSLALLIAMQSLNLGATDVHYLPGKGLRLGSLLIRTDDALRIHPRVYRDTHGRAAFNTYSFADVLNGNVDPNVFRDKILLIGPVGMAQGGVPAETRLGLLADAISSILNQDPYYTPPWVKYVLLAAWGFSALYLTWLLPLLGNRLAGALTASLIIALGAASFYPLYTRGIWYSPTGPALLLFSGYWLIMLKRRLFNGQGLLPGSNANLENLRVLGLAFQSQGQLDLAFDRFRHLPINEQSLELLYSLALDFERKRRFDKAKTVYEYITRHRRHYRDIRERMKRTQTLSEISLAPHPSNGDTPGNGGTLILHHSGVQKPMLGRYEVEQEIGRGAMSTVYEGKDPKIGRRVAIKTLPLSTEFQGEELEQVKARFYREAETAGQLSHPNIVTIFDAGEEDDVAYIAMEYLHGRNLTHFVGKAGLLPVSIVLEIVAKCALALDYAHRHQVVHRDVKPANIVYNIDTGDVKLTDFGIARITDASKTRTGVIMGTPSYMSPEQLAGRKLDGRSDLFSLGITCFQLLTGAPPFHADTMATLMYKITNEAHPGLNALRDDLAPCVSPIINKVLQKNPDKRFQTGRELANQLLRCARDIREQMA